MNAGRRVQRPAGRRREFCRRLPCREGSAAHPGSRQHGDGVCHSEAAGDLAHVSSCHRANGYVRPQGGPEPAGARRSSEDSLTRIKISAERPPQPRPALTTPTMVPLPSPSTTGPPLSPAHVPSPTRSGTVRLRSRRRRAGRRRPPRGPGGRGSDSPRTREPHLRDGGPEREGGDRVLRLNGPCPRGRTGTRTLRAAPGGRAGES